MCGTQVLLDIVSHVEVPVDRPSVSVSNAVTTETYLAVFAVPGRMTAGFFPLIFVAPMVFLFVDEPVTDAEVLVLGVGVGRSDVVLPCVEAADNGGTPLLFAFPVDSTVPLAGMGPDGAGGACALSSATTQVGSKVPSV